MVRFSRRMESGGDTDMRVAKNLLKLLPGILGREIDDRYY
jgi:hypothetical protein